VGGVVYYKRLFIQKTSQDKDGFCGNMGGDNGSPEVSLAKQRLNRTDAIMIFDHFRGSVPQGQESGKRENLQTQVKLYFSLTDFRVAKNPILYEVRLYDIVWKIRNRIDKFIDIRRTKW
jgi:hypothetical protein